MRQSKLFTKARKEAPKDEVSKNAELLIRGGFIHKEMAGVYSYLPLGLKVLKNIEKIIRQEMNLIGGQEVLLTTLQDSEVWSKTGRWDDDKVDNWFKTHLHNGNKYHKGSELGVANTHEEPLTNLLKEYISSYRDLPVYIYQIQNKFRNELRAKSGIMRGREFMMKDLYSFSRNEEEFKEFYEKCAQAYLKIFERVGMGDITFRTFASGGSFSKFSDEFQTLSEAGEDIIYLSKSKKIAVNKEVYNDETLKELNLDKTELTEEKSIEVGNIFPLGTRFSKPLDLTFKDEKGNENLVIMGSYGIGLGRLMGAVVETLSDNKGIVWPKEISPFKVHLLKLGKDESVSKEADDLYKKLTSAGIETLYDDREVSAGEKFSDADLIGIPTRIVISKDTIKTKKIEIKKRTSSDTQMLSEEKLMKVLKKE